ncbi:MAG: hypothetical protein ABR989_07660 [Candidatus Binatus soli]|jgi:hypothetical protein
MISKASRGGDDGEPVASGAVMANALGAVMEPPLFFAHHALRVDEASFSPGKLVIRRILK